MLVSHHLCRAHAKPYIDGVLVHLEYCAQYFTSFQARLAGQRVANVEQLWERHGDDLVKICAALARLESVDLAYRQQALHTGEDGLDVPSIQQLYGNVEEVGPFRGKVVCEYLLEGRDELQAHLGRRGDEDRDQTIAEGSLLFLWYGCGLGVLFRGRPALGYAVLEVDDGCGHALALKVWTGRRAGACLLERRTALFCSCSRMSSRPPVKPGFSSA